MFLLGYICVHRNSIPVILSHFSWISKLYFTLGLILLIASTLQCIIFNCVINYTKKK